MVDRESEDELKYLLGNMGIEILIAIENGAKNFETIRLFSGIPFECIKGRIPVLKSLNLIELRNREYNITEKGKEFRNVLRKNYNK